MIKMVNYYQSMVIQMTDDNKFMINLWMHKCASYNFEIIYQVDASIEISTKWQPIGKHTYKVNIYNNNVIITVENNYHDMLGALYLNPTDNSSTIFYRQSNSIQSIKIENLDLVLDSEESYFQQSLVQNIPLSYPEMLHFNREMIKIREKFFKQYNIVEQKGIDSI